MPRLVRRQSLFERLRSRLDIYDLLLWLAEELNDDAYDAWLQLWATPIGLAQNFLFVVARGRAARGGGGTGGEEENVFADSVSTSRWWGGKGWLAWMCVFLVYALAAACMCNAAYVLLRTRSYRLFEQPVEHSPGTTSASRVRVDSSPAFTSSVFQTLFPSAFSRAYPDPSRDVWELQIWDPKPFNLSILTLFSPGHVLLYCMLLPCSPLDPRPTATVLAALASGAFLSVQLCALRARFAQQARDNALLQGQVMREYDAKFVRPALQREVREVGTQTHAKQNGAREVDLYATTTLVRRGFSTRPNENYKEAYDPDGATAGAVHKGTDAGGAYQRERGSSQLSPRRAGNTGGFGERPGQRAQRSGVEIQTPRGGGRYQSFVHLGRS